MQTKINNCARSAYRFIAEDQSGLYELRVKKIGLHVSMCLAAKKEWNTGEKGKER